MRADEPQDEDRRVDDVIRAALAAVTPSQWAAVLAARDGVSRLGPFGSWGGGEQIGEKAFTMPYAIHGPEVEAAQRAMEDAGLIVAFAWPEWQYGRDLAGDRRRWPTMTPVEGVRMWVACVRSARFSEGALLAAADDGLLAAALTAVLEARPES